MAMTDGPLTDVIEAQTDVDVLGGQDDPPYIDLAPGLTDDVHHVIQEAGFAIDGKAARKDSDIGRRYTRVFLRETGDADG